MNILVLCTGNSCRSQMAHGFLKKFLPNHNIFSAGTEPHGVNPLAIEVMAEINIDISNNQSNHVDEYLNKHIDVVITVCDDANEQCPIFPGSVERIHKSFNDPSKLVGNKPEIMDAFRRTREEIRQFCKDFASIYVS